MIQSIGFKNFRRFENFPDMELGKINIFVGRNNSGKSTFVKGMMLLLDNLMHLDVKGKDTEDNDENKIPTATFEFDAYRMHDLHMGTFKNALYAGVSNGDVITFSMFIDGILVEMDVHGDRSKTETTGNMTRFRLCSELDGVDVTLNFIEQTMVLKVMSVQTNKEEIDETKKNLRTISDGIMLISRTLRISSDPVAISDLNIQLSKLKDTRKILNSKLKDLEKEGSVSADLSDTTQILYSEFADNIYSLITDTAYASARWIGGKSVSKKSIFASQLIGENADKIRHMVYRFKRSLESLDVQYIYAHSVSQKQILNSNDRTDYLAQTIHEYMKLNVQPGDNLNNAMIKSLKEFDFGKNYRVTNLEGEAYMVEIEDEFGWSNLANKGMGSIQLFTLMLRLNMIEHANSKERTTYVFIEEPEQNLHPSYQSELAKKFKEMSENGVYCIVETHSECLTRGIQAMVADANYKDDEDLKNNPFNIYYFDSYSKDRPWYRMEFETTGAFKAGSEFGPGFYDVAADLDMKIIRKEMSNNNPFDL